MKPITYKQGNLWYFQHYSEKVKEPQDFTLKSSATETSPTHSRNIEILRNLSNRFFRLSFTKGASLSGIRQRESPELLRNFDHGLQALSISSCNPSWRWRTRHPATQQWTPWNTVQRQAYFTPICSQSSRWSYQFHMFESFGRLRCIFQSRFGTQHFNCEQALPTQDSQKTSLYCYSGSTDPWIWVRVVFQGLSY
jgi:hypothetical protein